MGTLKTILSYINKGLDAIGRFLRYVYAAEITIIVISVFLFVFGHKLLSVILLIWGMLLAFNQYKHEQL